MNALTLSTALLLVFSSVFTLTALAQSTQRDDAEITWLVATMEEGWAKKEGALFAQPFAENSDYVIINGMHLKGRMAIANGHQHIFDTFYKGTRIKTTMEGIRYLKPDVAIAHFRSNLTGTINGKAVDGIGRITLTLMKEAGKWEIQAFQNTSIEAQPDPQRTSGN